MRGRPHPELAGNLRPRPSRSSHAASRWCARRKVSFEPAERVPALRARERGADARHERRSARAAPQGARAEPARRRPTVSLGERGGARGSRPGSRQRDIQDLVDGSVIEGPLGACFVAEQTLTLDHRHGDERAWALLRRDRPQPRLSGAVRRAAGRSTASRSCSWTPRRRGWPAAPAPTRSWSGWPTSGATSCWCGSISCATMPRSRPCWRRWRRCSSRHEAVVTFNGKSFDVPLLLTRYTANRQRHGADGDPPGPAAPVAAVLARAAWNRARSGRWSGPYWATARRRRAVLDDPGAVLPLPARRRSRS